MMCRSKEEIQQALEEVASLFSGQVSKMNFIRSYRITKPGYCQWQIQDRIRITLNCKRDFMKF